MPEPNIVRVRDFHGLRPSIAHVQEPEAGVIRGRNFRFKLSGPYSGWGNTVTTPKLPVDATQYPWIAVFKLLDQIVFCAPTGLFTWSQEHCSWVNQCPNEPRIWTNCEDNEYPWTTAMVGGAWYFSHPTFGVGYYDVDKCDWGKCDFKCHEVDEKGKFIPLTEFSGDIIAEPIYGITQANNRLILLAKDTVSWSNIDEGCGIVANMYKGSGFQNLSVNHYGQPIGVYQTPNGFNVYTSNGTTTFTNRQDEASYRVDHLSYSMTPISPYAITSIDSKINIFLTKSGLYQTDGNYPQPFEPLVGDWLAREAIDNRGDLHSAASIRMFYSGEENELFISMTSAYDDYQDYVYNHSLVFSFNYQKWASFDQPHRYIGNVNTVTHTVNNKNLGFISHCQTLNHFDKSCNNELGCKGLDSYIDLGLFQLPFEQKITNHTQMQGYTLFTTPTRSIDNDYVKQPFQADGYEERTQQSSLFSTLAAATDDGESVHDLQWDVSALIKSAYSANNYSCLINGQYFIIQVSANNNGQYYDLKGLNVLLTV